ncbi:MAG: DUF1801 domain-containing protein [Chitinophagales bacterium]
MQSIDDFFHDLPKEEKAIALRLREIILQGAPDFKEEFSYGVPYYFRHRRVTCIWPASSAGGPKKGVFIGFCRGNEMLNEQKIIEMGNRKRFGLIRFYDVKEINEDVLMELLQEAIMIDEEVGRKKKVKKLRMK